MGSTPQMDSHGSPATGVATTATECRRLQYLSRRFSYNIANSLTCSVADWALWEMMSRLFSEGSGAATNRQNPSSWLSYTGS